MHHRSTLRAQTDVPVSVQADGVTFPCRAVDLSPQGVVLEPAAAFAHHDARCVYWLELRLDDRAVRALARPAWRNDQAIAFRFIGLDACDRLTISEHMDRSVKAGNTLH